MIAILIKASIVFPFIIFLLCTSCKSMPKAQDWEYKEFILTPGQSLNGMADKGWFVVNAFYDTENKETFFLLKRLKNNKPDMY